MTQVVLVNEYDEPVGVLEKMDAHRQAALHRAFSVFIFNTKGEMLLQQRALNKYHSGGLWTNACCSHPTPEEETRHAASRRLMEEMGFQTALQKAFHFTYRAELDNGLTEYEYDHVYTGVYDGAVRPCKLEVNDYCFQSMEDISKSLFVNPVAYTAWFHIAFPMIEKWVATGSLTALDTAFTGNPLQDSMLRQRETSKLHG